MGLKVISMYTLMQNYLFSLYNHFGEGDRGQKQQLRNRVCFYLASENLLHEIENVLSEFIHCMCHQTYTKEALVLCRLKLLDIELSEICDTVFDRAIFTNFNWRIFSNTKYNVKTSILA